jgi:hypothetical protein
VKTNENTKNEATKDQSITYKLIVSFISKGAGTDSKKRTIFLTYVDGHALKPAYKKVILGREEETDYCFNLSEFTTKKDLVAFIDEIKKTATGSDLINLTEHAECIHNSK